MLAGEATKKDFPPPCTSKACPFQANLRSSPCVTSQEQCVAGSTSACDMTEVTVERAVNPVC